MATTTRQATKTITMPPVAEESVPEPVTQRKPADSGRFRLQVDRQTKASYATYEAAEKAGLAIKKEHPILQVAVYDGIESVNKIIELPYLMNVPRGFERCPGQISWHYDRAEIVADGVVHAIGVCLGLIGAVTIVVMAVMIERIDLTPILVYVIGLITMLVFSAAYNMWPVSPVKWVLRRFDHSAIYLLIAGTYTPFVGQMKNALASAGLGIGVWLSAAVGMALKLALPGRFDRLAVILCLLLGWSGVIAYDSLASTIPSSSLWLLAIGGILYSLGTVFHVWRRLRFHNAIWHGFVLLAASCHYSAVLACLPWE